MFLSEVRDGDIIRRAFFMREAVRCGDCLCCACFEMVRNSSMGEELVKNKLVCPALQTWSVAGSAWKVHGLYGACLEML